MCPGSQADQRCCHAPPSPSTDPSFHVADDCLAKCADAIQQFENNLIDVWLLIFTVPVKFISLCLSDLF